MIITFEELNKYSFAITDIGVLYQEPSFREFKTSARRHNGFMYLSRGECVYECDGERTPLTAGSLIYLPLGSKHTLTVVSDAIAFYRIDFNVVIGGELALFSEGPKKITDAVTPSFKARLAELCEECRFDDNTVFKTEKLIGMLASLLEHPTNLYKSKIGPAIKYLHSHFAEPIDCSHLAAICFLGRAQLYNLFHSYLGLTPLGYRDRLLVRQAQMLLLSGELSVSEISETLGFSSVAYFSRFFKKNTGKNPTEYAKGEKNE
ncbi:MAG: helix-turn-helix domain-containing protein [Clostridia bacterium]|nr:helix-turn-helix domain-containing protein [Clostridia bacterium]